MKKDDQTITTDEQIKQLVVARIRAVPDDMDLSIGDVQFTKDELIGHVQQGDEIGQQIIDIQLEYLRDLASGALYQNE